MRLYFIRHAQSENNHLWDQTGSNKGRSEDPQLTEIGRQQAKILAEFLRQAGPGSAPEARDAHNREGFGLTHLYTSPMVRAVETGLMVARALGLPLTVWRDLHEGGGIYLDDEETGLPVGLPGKPRRFFEETYPDLVLTDELKPEGWWNRPFEERPERAVRAQRVLTELLQRHGGTHDRVAFFSHGGFYNWFVNIVLKRPGPEGIWFVFNNVAITRIDFNEEWIDFVYQNRVNLLPPELVT